MLPIAIDTSCHTPPGNCAQIFSWADRQCHEGPFLQNLQGRNQSNSSFYSIFGNIKIVMKVRQDSHYLIVYLSLPTPHRIMLEKFVSPHDRQYLFPPM